jgi:hypothetical protein
MTRIPENINEAIAEEREAEKSLVDTMIDEKLPGLIEKLPSELQPLAKVFAPVLVRMSVEEIKAFVNGDWVDPVGEYRKLYARLDTQQAIDAGETLKEYWKSLNVENANVVLEQNKAIDDLVVAGLLMLKVAMA